MDDLIDSFNLSLFENEMKRLINDRDGKMTSTLYHTHKSAGISIIHEGLPKIATVHCYDGANIATFNLEARFPKQSNSENQMQKQQLNYDQFRCAPPPQLIERRAPKRTVNPVYMMDQNKFIENIEQANFNQSLNRPFNQTQNNPVNQTVNQTVSHPINRSINQPINQRTVPPNNQPPIHDRDAIAKNGVWVCNHCGLIILNGDSHNCFQQNESKGMPQLDYYGPGIQQSTHEQQFPNKKMNRKPRKSVIDTNRFDPENNYDDVMEANRAFRKYAYNGRFAVEAYSINEYTQQDPRNIIYAKDVINQQQQLVKQLAIDTPQVDPIIGGVPKILNSYSTAYVDSISPNSITSNDINDERLIQAVNHSESSTKDTVKKGKRMTTNICIKCNKPKWQTANSNLPFDGCKCHETLTPISVPDLKREEVSPPRKKQCSQIIIIDDPIPLNLRDLDLDTSSTPVNIVENNLYKGDGISNNKHPEDINNETILDQRHIEMAIEPLLNDSELMKIKKEISDGLDELRTKKGEIINAINEESKETLSRRNFEFSSGKEIITSKIHKPLPSIADTTNKTIEPKTTVTTDKVNQFVENKQNEVICTSISDVKLDKENSRFDECKPPTRIINVQSSIPTPKTIHYGVENNDKLLPRKEKHDGEINKSLVDNEKFANETNEQMQYKEVNNSKNVECTQHKESNASNINRSSQYKQINTPELIKVDERVNNKLKNKVLDVKNNTNSFSNREVLQNKAVEVCKSINSSRKDNLNYKYTLGGTANIDDEIFLLKEDVIKKGTLPLKGDNVNGGNQIPAHKDKLSSINDQVLNHRDETVDRKNEISSSNARDKSGKNKILEEKVEVLTSSEVIMPRKLEVIYSINEKVEVVSSSYDLTTCLEKDANNNNENLSHRQELFDKNNENSMVQDLYDEIFDLVIDESFE